VLQRRFDVAEGLVHLLGQIVGDRHLGVVEAGRAGDEDPLAIDHGAGIAIGFLKARSR
jgi:hypothetical protein